MNLHQHPLSAAFPALPPESFQALVDSIVLLGVQNPITLYQGQVLDGWNRYTAAQEAGMDCPTVDLADWIDPVQFVRAQNKDRRHLPTGAWALIEVSLSAWRSSGISTKAEPSSALGRTSQQMAQAVGTSERTIRQAKVVHEQATPEVREAVRRGEIGLPKAVAISKLPKGEQAAAIKHPQAKTPKPTPPEPTEPPPNYTALDEAQDQIADLQAELALAHLGTDADPKPAADLIAALQAEVKTLSAVLRATEQARDALLEERAQMLAQLKAQRGEIARLKK